MPNTIDKCEVHCIHPEQVEFAQKNMLNEDTAQSLADIFKILGDNTRVKIIYSLILQELCVCDIAAVINASESSVSHHLRLLRTHKLVKFRREGKVLYYSLDDEHVETLINQGLEHVNE
ncbi:MAG TPA: metalloregulator ArsR/SmtB family transcription factor [Syntrophomonadaceae bacterium]|nr:metalloregulator ArsR/SmtB family transcription factor [Syntrophomonadaceae bacterium]